MQISLFDSFTRKIGIVAIAGYQKHISPHKGFVCAHRVLHGGESCSAYIKRVIAEEGLIAGWGKSHTRFQACKQANLTLQRVSQMANSEPSEQAETETGANKQSKHSRQKSANSYSSGSYCGDSCSDCSDIPDCNSLADCASLDCSGADCGSLNCSSLDCGSSDCGSLDCDGCGN